ncbi:MAG: fluoride efflux transporter CrcB [Saprospiraceae bacterium]|nr:fluoride efflux transporter CrcB [Saprospiraceae bacterium]
MMSLIAVFMGGGVGSICRYLLVKQYNYSGQEYLSIPYGTAIANLLSCFILGILIQKQFDGILTENSRLLLATGFCGGFSTFSTFGYEIYMFIEKGQLLFGLGYTFLSLFFGILAIFIGIKLMASI